MSIRNTLLSITRIAEILGEDVAKKMLDTASCGKSRVALNRFLTKKQIASIEVLGIMVRKRGFKHGYILDWDWK